MHIELYPNCIRVKHTKEKIPASQFQPAVFWPEIKQTSRLPRVWVDGVTEETNHRLAQVISRQLVQSKVNQDWAPQQTALVPPQRVSGKTLLKSQKIWWKEKKLLFPDVPIFYAHIPGSILIRWGGAEARRQRRYAKLGDCQSNDSQRAQFSQVDVESVWAKNDGTGVWLPWI